MAVQNNKQTAKEPTYTKQQLKRSIQFKGKGDILEAVLENKSYTLADAEAEIKNFLKHKGGN